MPYALCLMPYCIKVQILTLALIQRRIVRELFFLHAAATAVRGRRDRSLLCFPYFFFIQRLQPLALDVTEPFGRDRALHRVLLYFYFYFYTAAPAARFRRDRALRAPSWGVTKNSAL